MAERAQTGLTTTGARENDETRKTTETMREEDAASASGVVVGSERPVVLETGLNPGQL